MAVCLMGGTARAQFLPQLQAKTPAEFDAYLDVVESAAGQRVERARGFLSAYPQSDMRLRVYELLAEACRQRGDAACATQSARAGLELAGDYIPLLTLLASVEANTSAKPDPAVAERALALLDQVKAPKTISPEEWMRETGRLRAENLASLGITAYKRGDLPGAISRLEESARIQPTAANEYRLAMLYASSKRVAEARHILERISRATDAILRERAAAALASLPRQ